jgi:hypothetical protein
MFPDGSHERRRVHLLLSEVPHDMLTDYFQRTESIFCAGPRYVAVGCVLVLTGACWR